MNKASLHAYVNNVKRRRRRIAESFAPAALGSSLLAWWSADDTALITVTGSGVSSWKDSVNGYDMVQATDAARPPYSATSFNGSPGVTFAGDSLTMASMPFPSGAAPVEVWAVVDQTSPASDVAARCIFSYGGSVVADIRRFARTVSGGANLPLIGVGDGVTGSGANGAGVFEGRCVYRGTVLPTVCGVSIDNDPPVTGARVPATVATLTRIGAAATTAVSQGWVGVIRDVIVTEPLSAEKAALMYSFLMPRRNL